MPELNAKLFRDYFGGSWSAKIFKNGEFQREIIFNWPAPLGNFSALGTEAGFMVPQGGGILDDTRQVAIAGWRNDTKRWCAIWYNEYGGYGELQWTSQKIVDGVAILYGSLHECKQEGDDFTDHSAKCELFDQNNFKYTIQSFRKGILEIIATRIRTGDELNELLEKHASKLISISELGIM